MATDDPIRTNPSTEGQDTVAFRAVPELGPGTLLNDRYLLTRQLDRGGFGTVYLAHDRQMHDRPVVVKIQIDQRVDDPWFERKFSEEVRALSMIDHPGVVVAIDSGRTPDGKPFLVMQYVDGVTLRAVMNPEGMPLDRAAEILKQVGHALGAAHDRGILHRDLKPENLMLQTITDGGERVRLIDFGIATVADIENKYQSSTRVSGTVFYMAPEQLVGQPTALSDIYAMGLIAYEMVTGRRPFMAENAVQLSTLQRSGVRVRPSDLRASLPIAAERLILKSLEYEPSKRPPNARAFGDDLRDALLGSGAPVTRVKAEVGSGIIYRRRWMIGSAAAIVAAVLAGTAYYRLQSHPESRKPQPEQVQAVDPRSASSDSAVELAFWDSVKVSSDPQLYREYLANYPHGYFASLAKLKLEALARKASPDAEDARREAAGSAGEDKTEIAFWRKIEKTMEPELYQEYLDTYPHGHFEAIAQTKLNSSRNKRRATFNITVPGIPDLGTVPMVNPRISAELSDWNALKDAKDAQPYRDYLVKYPNGMFATVARMKIAAFDKAADN